MDSVDDAYDESKGRPTFGVVTNSCEPWTTCSEFYKDVMTEVDGAQSKDSVYVAISAGLDKTK